MASQSLGAVQDIIADREANIKSIATVFGARVTIFFSLSCYILASVLLASLGGFAILLAILGLTYVLNLLPFIRITDQEAEKTRAAWRRFLWINYLYGTAVTFVLIAITVNA
jgi:4-hydroxybenzoate polyprenyltransferase